MRRLLVPIVVIAFAVGCGERAAMPTSPLAPGAASRAAGTPPPPPISGDGFADIDAFSRDDSSLEAASCSAHGSFSFSYDYFVNNPGNNAFLHISVGGGGNDVSIHQTDKKLDAKGVINGTGFTFSIADAVGGTIKNEDQTLPSRVELQLTGTLTTGETTCAANATLHISLTGDFEP